MSEFLERWKALRPDARKRLEQRDYGSASLAETLASRGLEAARLLESETELRDSGAWIPGVEVFARRVFPQRQRGCFGELGREGEGTLGAIGFWPKQWSTARMDGGTAKGFHIHPPFVPPGREADEWFAELFGPSAAPDARPYSREQWDVMYVAQGRLEMLLVDERAGFPRRLMRFFIDGDNHRGPNNAAVVIPPGVAHAMRTDGSEDVVMIYGTSTTFRPESEGRLASGIETAPLPAEWESYIRSASTASR